MNQIGHLLDNSLDNQQSEINKNNIFHDPTYCLLQKLSSYIHIQ